MTAPHERYAEARAALPHDEVSFGFMTVYVHRPAELENAQAGYSGEGWREDWLVIGYEDATGDPLFVDTSAEALPVYTAMHGEGSWEPELIADSFTGFGEALGAVAEVANGRANPVELESNPLPDEERERVLARIERANPRSSTEFWSVWLESD